MKYKTLPSFFYFWIQTFLFFCLFNYGSLALQGQSALSNFDPSTPDGQPDGDPSKDLPNQPPPDRDDEDDDDTEEESNDDIEEENEEAEEVSAGNEEDEIDYDDPAALRSELENKKKELSQSRKTNQSLTDNISLLHKKNLEMKAILDSLKRSDSLDKSIMESQTPHTVGWYFQPQTGWLWTHEDVFPMIYSAKLEGWYFFKQGTSKPSVFFNYKKEEEEGALGWETW